MEHLFSIYQTEDISEVEGLQELINDLGVISSIEVKKDSLPAFADAYGSFISLLMSDNVQTILSLIAVGDIVWRIINIVKKAGKKLDVGKVTCKALALSRIKKENPTLLIEEKNDNCIVWGPMQIEPTSAELESTLGSIECNGSGVSGYMIAIALKKEPNKVRTIWQLFASDGTVQHSWITQTYAERVPEFINPYKANK